MTGSAAEAWHVLENRKSSIRIDALTLVAVRSTSTYDSTAEWALDHGNRNCWSPYRECNRGTFTLVKGSPFAWPKSARTYYLRQQRRGGTPTNIEMGYAMDLLYRFVEDPEYCELFHAYYHGKVLGCRCGDRVLSACHASVVHVLMDNWDSVLYVVKHVQPIRMESRNWTRYYLLLQFLARAASLTSAPTTHMPLGPWHCSAYSKVAECVDEAMAEYIMCGGIQDHTDRRPMDLYCTDEEL